MRRVLTTLAAVGLLAGACGTDDALSSDGRPPGGDDIVVEIGGDDVQLTSALSGFDSCDTLLDHLRSEGAERVGPWGFDDGWYGGWWPVDGPVAMADDMAGANAVDDSDGSVSAEAAPATTVPAQGGDGADLTEGVDFSGTNIQESGVDEADVVKTDGERVYIVANNELVIVDVATRAVVGTVVVPQGDRAELFIDGDNLLLVNQGWNEVGIVDDVASDAAVVGPYPSGGSRTTITRITVDGDTPRILETLAAEGDYVSARAVDGTARIIVRSNPQYNFPFVFPQGEAGEDRAEQSNREAILDSELTDWLPSYTLLDANGAQTGDGLLVPCEQVHAPTEFAGFGVLSVLTVAVDGTIDPTTTSSVLAPGEVVYASTESVYVATTSWFDLDTVDAAREQIVENVTTSIHRFDIASDTSAAYTASGSVDGLVRDSYSFSEYDGHLRVVTTTGNNWDETSESFVRVLKEEGDELVEVGSVGDMGNGEAVQSVRFQGDVGYVVTFRQVDPLYTLDLSDPTDPVVRGELKIPGFSSYLHPIGDGLVIGVGSDADEQTGQVTGSKVSLFDVNDLANPQEVATWVGPDGWNDIGWDTHAFLWWAPENLAVIPISTWDRGEQWAGVVLLRIEGSTITEVGRFDHVDETVQTGQTDCRVITDDELPNVDEGEFQSELEYMVTDEYSLILDCEEGETRSATGYECYDEPWLAEEAVRIGLEAEGTIVSCWPIGDGVPQIRRSIVLPDGELWTVSSPWGWLGGSGPARLQVNDLTTLDRLGAVDL
ncbi:MAG: beta-propeller domain-containing protein [Acidimicrobiales bacterium]